MTRPYLRVASHGAETLQQAFTKAGGNMARAARDLGLSERQFAYRWRKLGLQANRS